ncbi:MAG: cysteine desulfurase [Flavobacteriia bacterium]|nr:cysteine desulfurase [Flavobacteriia bacterium]
MENTISFDINNIRKQFPVLSREVNGKPLVYMDNGATTHKPKAMTDAITDYYERINSNVHRGVHHLSQQATDAFEVTREKLRAHINAEHTHEVIFTKGTTDSINTVAWSFGELVKPGDEIIISTLEHHSNIVPWQMMCERKGATLKVIPMDDRGVLDMEAYGNLLSEKTVLVAFNHISNALGTINPVKKMAAMAHEVGAAVMIDGAQSMPHLKVDVRDLDVDFYAISAHKMYGPTGIGALYGKEEWLNKLPPYQGGGEMIATVTFEKTTYADLPHKFEAGTPHIEGVIAWAASIDWLNNLGMENITNYEAELLDYGTKALNEVEGMIIHGNAPEKSALFSFNIDGLHPYDVGTLLDQLGIAVRTGHHCTQPLMNRLNVPGTIRASLGLYNTKEEIDTLVAGLNRVIPMLK